MAGPCRCKIHAEVVLEPESRHYPPTRQHFEAHSLPQSQTSSFNGSFASQQSGSQPLAVRELDSCQQPLNAPYTPATSLSNNSSQEPIMNHEDAQDPRTHMENNIRASATDQASQLQLISTQSPTSHQAYTSAPKRMANGDIKSPPNSYPTSPIDPNSYAHSRNSSSTSRTSHIGEVSQIDE